MTNFCDTQAIGKLHTLWTAFSRFYERHGDIENARVIFEKATQVVPSVNMSEGPDEGCWGACAGKSLRLCIDWGPLFLLMHML